MTRKKTEKLTEAAVGFAPTMAAAASITGLPPEVISAAKERGCKAFRTRGDVDCDELRRWISENPDVLEIAKDINIAVEEALKVRADRQLKEHKLAEAKRKVISIDEVKRTYTRNIFAAKSKLLASEKPIAMACRLRIPKLTDDDVAIIAEEVSRQHRDALRSLTRSDWFNQQCPNCTHEL